jgi:hypothetical protein
MNRVFSKDVQDEWFQIISSTVWVVTCGVRTSSSPVTVRMFLYAFICLFTI